MHALARKSLWTTELVLLKVYHGSFSRVSEADKMRETLTKDELPIALLISDDFEVRLVF